MDFLLVGNPNSGKTTLYNRLTGAREQVGNRMGVTVETKRARVRGTGHNLVDLPGLYALAGGTREEEVSQEAILRQKPDCIINIVDATNLARGLLLTSQLCELGLPLILVLNMADECRAKGIRIDYSGLARKLGFPVLPISARSGEGLPGLLATLERLPAAARPFCGKLPTAKRPAAIDALLAGLVVGARAPRVSRTDKVLLHPVWGLAFFTLVMALLFTLTFDTVGAWLSDLLEGASEVILQASRFDAPRWLSDFLTDGVLAALLSVLTFLPQIALLFGLLSLLEDWGYLARVSFLMDGVLSKIGLDGKAFVPLLMGFGCSVPALMGARTLDCARCRKRTAALIPYLSCSAKLPVYGLLARLFFPMHRGLVVWSLYVLGVFVGICVLLLMNRLQKRSAPPPFLMELPPYRRPTFRNTWAQMSARCGHFLRRAGTVILLMSVLVWLAMHLSPDLAYTEDSAQSLAALFGTAIAPVFAPLGFAHPGASVSLLLGLIAKEGAASTLLLYAGGEAGLLAMFTPLSAYCYLVFFSLYPPCFAAIATLHKEFRDWRSTLMGTLVQLLVAYGVANLMAAIERILFL
ncbi:MAG: ferrous iron transporter B [Clostridiales bacterium]|nr:ferrous iron transporter B [Clostridiales bacterium]